MLLFAIESIMENSKLIFKVDATKGNKQVIGQPLSFPLETDAIIECGSSG